MPKINNKAELESFICSNWNDLQADLDRMGQQLPLPFYCSVDIREGFHKFAAVDNNLYPAGFNNLCNIDLGHAGEEMKQFIQLRNPQANWVGIFCESHTKNTYYLDHLLSLKRALAGSGLNVIIGSTDEELFAPGEKSISLVSNSLGPIEIEKFKLNQNEFYALQSDRILNFVVMNNDQSRPLDLPWEQIKTPVHPPASLGWYRREKFDHFRHYHEVVENFCQRFDINPDLLRANYDYLIDLDFNKKEGLEELASRVDKMIEKIGEGKKIFVKASRGTYGMGISVVNSGAEILEMNRKVRNKMDVGKNNLKFTSVLIQEGVETIVKYADSPAEVTIYLVNGQPSGGFVRSNPLRDSTGNLNAKGMLYQKYCLAELKQGREEQSKLHAYTLVARLSAMAAGMEIQNNCKKI